jgi:glycosyltransferase involved in cell wall biosynthesis
MREQFISERTASPKLSVTVVILTKNEQTNLPGCLNNVRLYFDDVIVLDSGSTDGTLAIAREAGVPAYVNPFTGFGDQRNFAIDQIRHQYAWSLHLDADERVTEPFIEELRDVLTTDPMEAGFYVPNRLMLGDRWLRYSSGYPVYQVRLFHRERLRFENWGHGQREVTDGRLGYFKQPYLHYGFSHGLSAWMQKHVLYAEQEAIQAISDSEPIWRTLCQAFSFRAVPRRRAWKRLSYHFPFRSDLRFLYTLVLKRGFLDGRAGWTYASMLATYESMFATHLSAKARGGGLNHRDST